MIDLLTPGFEIEWRNSGECGQSHATVSQVLRTSLPSALQRVIFLSSTTRVVGALRFL